MFALLGKIFLEISSIAVQDYENRGTFLFNAFVLYHLFIAMDTFNFCFLYLNHFDVGKSVEYFSLIAKFQVLIACEKHTMSIVS